MYKNILLALENSKFDGDAIETAENLAKTLNSRITLMQVMEILPIFQEDKEAEYRAFRKKCDSYLPPIKKRLEEKNISADIVVKTGTPGLVICKYAEENDIDLVIMPVHDLGGNNRIIVGYAAREVFRHSPKPVLFVRSGPRDILRGRTILVVDDEPDILDILEEELSMCVVHKAQDKETAINLIENNWFDIVILDIMGVDGFNILKKTVRRGIPTVMLTAHAMTKDALKQAADLGATSFLPKEKMSELDTFLSDVIRNSGMPVWEKLFERLSTYFDNKFGWTPEEEKELVSKHGKWDE